MSENIAYPSDVMEARDGTEQRVSLVRHAQGGIEFGFVCKDVVESEIAAMLLYRYQDARWIVPLWPFGEALTAAANPTDTTLLLDTTDIPFQDSLGLGGYAMIWKDAETYEVVSIASVTAGVVSLSSPVVGTWPIGTKVLPCRIGILDGAVVFPWLNREFASGRVRFIFDSDQQSLGAGSGDTIIFGDIVVPTT